ncbi:MAG: cyclic nucleotide-binding domain-containing protein [Bdellovibrionales bacterium]|nr:cyclic nucleotide-binding domain-containing protein [Bdellovibrionales bacterium]
MRALRQATPELDLINTAAKQATTRFLAALPVVPEPYDIPADTRLFSKKSDRDFLCCVRSGTVLVKIKNHVLFRYDEFDLLGISEHLGEGVAIVHTDTPVVVDLYPVNEVFDAMDADPSLGSRYFELLAWQTARFSRIIALYTRPSTIPPAQETQLQAGDLLFERHQLADRIYIVLEGVLAVEREGRILDSVGAGELCGHVSACAGVPRQATVRAQTTARLLSLPTEDFLQAMEARPGSLLQLAESLATTLAQPASRLHP